MKGFNPPQGSQTDLSSIDEDVLPDSDSTWDLGSAAKKWAQIFAVSVIATAISIGGFWLAITASGDWLEIGINTTVNGSINATENITAKYFYGDGSQLTGVAGGGDINAVYTNDDYLVNGSASGEVFLEFNQTRMNATIEDLDTDTYNSTEEMRDAINNTQGIMNLDQVNITGNMTFGNHSITWNSTTLSIKVN